MSSDGHDMLMSYDLSANVAGMQQDRDSLLLTMDNDSIIVFDWNVVKQCEEVFCKLSTTSPVKMTKLHSTVENGV